MRTFAGRTHSALFDVTPLKILAVFMLAFSCTVNTAESLPLYTRKTHTAFVVVFFAKKILKHHYAIIKLSKDTQNLENLIRNLVEKIS